MMCSLRLVLAAALMVGACGGTAGSRDTTAARLASRRAPDVHGDPLELLPQGAVMWAGVDAAALRASPHFDGGMSLARDLGADFAMVERELGFDAFRQAQRIAFAIYLPPGQTAEGGWPLVYARGNIQRETILSAARARNHGGAPSEANEDGLAYTVVGNRAYMFPAPDVMLVMERALVRRVAARLTGESTRTVLTDERFGTLWQEAGGRSGPFAMAMDLAAMRGRVRMEGSPAEAEALNAFVLHGDAPGAVTLRAVGEARDEASARTVIRTIDEARAEVGGQIAVRLLGLSRVLREGIRTRAEGRVVHVDVDATADEARRLLRASSLVRELTGRAE